MGLKVDYNSDQTMIEFKIKCRWYSGGHWEYGCIPRIFLTFLWKDCEAHKVLIAKTKGKIYASDPNSKISGLSGRRSPPPEQRRLQL